MGSGVQSANFLPYSSAIQMIVAESEMCLHEACLRGLAERCNSIGGLSDARASMENLPGVHPAVRSRLPDVSRQLDSRGSERGGA
jgi:hypothetical protein